LNMVWQLSHKWCMVYDFVKEYESVSYAVHLKWGPIQVRHHICYRACIVVTMITHSSYQMYIVLTFDSLFIVYMLTYVLTKFNTALGQ
jgi:heme O synthase-like polyprenyltransferase